jgi:DNA-binding response OmpR family regulator
VVHAAGGYRASSHSVEESPVAARRILIIEDEMMIAMMVEDFLKELGWDVVGLAGKETRALQMARDIDIDAALLDVNLGGRNTFAVADILSERRIPFVFATGYGIEGIADRFRNIPTLTKPFQRDELELALRRATMEAHPAGGSPIVESGS